MHPDKDPIRGDYIPGQSGQNQHGRWQSAGVRIVRLPLFGGTLGFGSMLAITVSYNHNESIGWAIVHGLLSWFYVI